MPGSQDLANVHGDHAGEKGDHRAIPAAVIEFTKAGAGQSYHESNQPSGIA